MRDLRDIWILLRLRTRQSWNVLIYGRDPKRRISLLGALGILMAIALVGIGLTTGMTWIFIEIATSAFAKMAHEHIIFSLFLLGIGLFLSWCLRDIGSALIRILEAKDVSTLLATRMSPTGYLFGKILERGMWQMLSDVAWGVPIIYWIWAKYGEVSIPFLLACATCYVVGYTVRLGFITTLLRWKLRGFRLLPWTFVTFLLHGCKWITIVWFLLILAAPLKLGILSQWAKTLQENGAYQVLMSRTSAFSILLTHTFSLLILHIFLWLLCCSMLISIRKNMLWQANNRLFEGLQQVRRPKSITSIRRPLERDIWKLPLPSSILWLIAKDIAHLRRTRTMESFMMLGFVLLGIATSAFTFYFVDRGVPVNFSGYYMTTSFGVLGTMSVMFTLLDRFGVDSEGPHLLLLRLAPVGVRDVIWSKWLLYCIISMPLTFMVFVIPLFLYPILWWQWVPVWCSVTLVFGAFGICATATYPNLYFESMLDLPSSKARWFYNGISAVYTTLIGFVWTTLPPNVTPWTVFAVSIPTSLVFLRAAMLRLERGEFDRHVSLESFTR